MTIYGLLESLEELIRNTLKEVRLPENPSGWDGSQTEREIKIYKQKIPDASDREQRVPYIILWALQGEDSTVQFSGENTVTVRIFFELYSEDSQEGTLAVLGIIDRLRLELLRSGTIGGRYTLQGPLEWLLYPEDTDCYYGGEMMTIWKVPAINRAIAPEALRWR